MKELAAGARVVGLKECRRAVEEERALRVYLAYDADPHLTEPLRELCRQKGVALTEDCTMEALGRAAGVPVKTAAAALLK